MKQDQIKRTEMFENVLTAPGLPAGKKAVAESLPGFNKTTKPHRFVDSIGFAWQGILYFFRHERNARIQLVVATLTI